MRRSALRACSTARLLDCSTAQGYPLSRRRYRLEDTERVTLATVASDTCPLAVRRAAAGARFWWRPAPVGEAAPAVRCSPLLPWMVDAGRLGRRTGSGFYPYP
ncbi:hypothetical protein [Streptomyces sp. NPDC058629]|uniref:hypothetical protein n=1 Tax=Streptomyces sp. NPDC058629 TaxID=3346565 RepID=UPI00365A8083